jgi:hypothetical protein
LDAKGSAVPAVGRGAAIPFPKRAILERAGTTTPVKLKHVVAGSARARLAATAAATTERMKSKRIFSFFVLTPKNTDEKGSSLMALYFSFFF